MAPTQTELTPDALRLDAAKAVDEIAERLRETTYRDLRRRGAVVGLSGGVDSSLVAFLCARAFGPERVLGVLMPEGESAPDTLDLSQVSADAAGVETVVEDITPILEAVGCYERRDAAIRTVMPEYGAG
ncbi:MAG: NAD(+) synthase, partial [Gaiellaceae bacterium]